MLDSAKDCTIQPRSNTIIRQIYQALFGSQDISKANKVVIPQYLCRMIGRSLCVHEVVRQIPHSKEVVRHCGPILQSYSVFLCHKGWSIAI